MTTISTPARGSVARARAVECGDSRPRQLSLQLAPEFGALFVWGAGFCHEIPTFAALVAFSAATGAAYDGVSVLHDVDGRSIAIARLGASVMLSGRRWALAIDADDLARGLERVGLLGGVSY